MRYYFLILLLSLLYVNSVQCQHIDSYDMHYLQVIIANRDFYKNNQELNILKTKDSLRTSNNESQKYQLSKSLFNLYKNFQLDSALVYSMKMQQYANQIPEKSKVYTFESQLHIARVLARTGKYSDCEKILVQEVFSNPDLSAEIKELYYSVKLELNRCLYDYANVLVDIKQLEYNIKSSLDSLVKYTPKNSIWYPIHLSNKYRAQQDFDTALKILLDYLKTIDYTDRQVAHVSYFISNLYRIKNDKSSEKKYLIISSIIDLKYSVREYVSLWKLATLLYEEGEFETSYKFIELSLNDATYSGAYRWNLQISNVLPMIYRKYNEKILEQRSEITLGIYLISALLSGVVLLMVYVMWQNKKLSHAKSTLDKTNEGLYHSNQKLNIVSNDLQISNTELKLLNTKLIFLNKELIEMNSVKEAYLSKFIDMCSEYIEKIDIYRMNLSRLFRNNKVEIVVRELQSTKFVENEFKFFLKNFDDTFLKVYPNFIEEYNTLFSADQWQSLGDSKVLNTEQRVFALVKLGIADSRRIAKFLRCSIATVYTYRSKAKNKSIYPEDFENRIINVISNQND